MICDTFLVIDKPIKEKFEIEKDANGKIVKMVYETTYQIDMEKETKQCYMTHF